MLYYLYYITEIRTAKGVILSVFWIILHFLEKLYTDRFRAEEEKLKRLTAERKKRDAESVAIGGMLFELTELEAPPIEFDEKLWHAVVDHVTVYHDDRLVYSLKDGTEITIEL